MATGGTLRLSSSHSNSQDFHYMQLINQRKCQTIPLHFSQTELVAFDLGALINNDKHFYSPIKITNTLNPGSLLQDADDKRRWIKLGVWAIALTIRSSANLVSTKWCDDWIWLANQSQGCN